MPTAGRRSSTIPRARWTCWPGSPRLTRAPAPTPGAWGRLPPGNAEAQTKGIVAFRMPLTRIETKIKLSQNRDLEDRTRVIAKLEASGNQDAQATAKWMKRVLP